MHMQMRLCCIYWTCVYVHRGSAWLLQSSGVPDRIPERAFARACTIWLNHRRSTKVLFSKIYIHKHRQTESWHLITVFVQLIFMMSQTFEIWILRNIQIIFSFFLSFFLSFTIQNFFLVCYMYKLFNFHSSQITLRLPFFILLFFFTNLWRSIEKSKSDFLLKRLCDLHQTNWVDKPLSSSDYHQPKKCQSKELWKSERGETRNWPKMSKRFFC